MAFSNVETNTYNNLNVNSASAARSVDTGLYGVDKTIVSDYQYGIERLDDSTQGLSNPSFKLTGSSPFGSIETKYGASAKITRGYIRRAGQDASDPTSKYRLYFMYNPETIERQYMAYLDQQALDPYNAMFGSNNMTAPPGILDFSFELMFDRHIEVSQDATHPGTRVDYDFFDRVVRGVAPDVPNAGNSIPDNGIMLVNPRNVAVVFSKDLVVHGRPYNASVSFEKFDHYMTPTRMTISITMKAFYIGPIQTIPNFNQFPSEDVYAATVPYEQSDIQFEAIDISEVTIPESETPTPYVTPNETPGTNGSVPSGLQGVPRYDPNNFWGFRVTQNPQVERVTLTDQQVLQVCKAANISKEIAYGLWGIAKFRESGFVTNAVNVNSNGSWDIGIWQINTDENGYGGKSRQQLTDPYDNAVAALTKYYGNGNTFAAWNTSPSAGKGNYTVDDGSWKLLYYGGPSFYEDSVAFVDKYW